MPRVLVTGLGAVSALGLGVRALWDGLCAGRNAFAPVSAFDASAYRCRIGAEVRGLKRGAFEFALAAACEALSDAGLKDFSPLRAGIALGSTFGEGHALECFLGDFSSLDEEARRRARPWSAARVPARVAAELGLRGPQIALMTACAAGNYAVAWAYDRILSGEADIMLAGGADVFAQVTFAGFSRLMAISPDLCRPFSLGRKGLIPSEGAAFLVLESEERVRGRRAYAEVLGYGLSSDARHVTQPDEEGVARSIRACLEDAGLTPGEVDYVNAHGTGTPANDSNETAALKRAFGARAMAVPVSSNKSMLGHAMGAASALEAVACCKTLETGILPPTANFVAGDPDCDLDYVPNAARRADPGVVLSNAFAFGGSNAVIAFAKPGARPARPAPAAARVVVTGIGTVEEATPAALAERLLPDKDLGRLDRPIALALCAAKRALDASGWRGQAQRAGIVLDSAGELESLFAFYKELRDEGPQGVEPELFPNILANAASSRAAIVLGLKRLNVSLAGSFPGGEAAVLYGAAALRRSGPGLILAGGVDEAACVFALETLEEARKRGAHVLAELASWQEGFDPEAVAPEHPGCFCLAKAVQKVAETRKLFGYQAKGLWGGWIRISLKPAE